MPKNLAELKKFCKQKWAAITLEFCRLIATYKEHLQTVISNNGLTIMLNVSNTFVYIFFFVANKYGTNKTFSITFYFSYYKSISKLIIMFKFG